MRLDDLFEIGGKVTRVAGDNVELDGGAVKIDLKKFDIDATDPNKPKLKAKKPGAQREKSPIEIGKDLEITTEAINDPNIFKAIFLAGGPGSGKSYVYKSAIRGASGDSLKVVNPDNAYEMLLSKANLDIGNPDDIASPEGQRIRGSAKRLADKQEELYREGRLGLVIDGTGKEIVKIKEVKDRLEELGYDTMMVFVNTDLETNLEQNAQRSRRLPEKMIKEMWSTVQKNVGKFQSIFGSKNFLIVDNSKDQRNSVGERLDDAAKEIRSFLGKEPSKPSAIKWIESQK